MTLKQSTNIALSEQQRLDKLARLCEELQAAVDHAGNQRRLLEEVRQVAQELLTDAELKPGKRKKTRNNG